MSLTTHGAVTAPLGTTTAFHWVLTVQTANGGIHTLSGGTYLRPGQSRAEVFAGLLEQAATVLATQRPVVLFFSLERDELTPADRLDNGTGVRQ
ncbi:hypothetical protein [Kitasatospora sp. GAS1066B]|uniref:hypothetical protein n=1 Tax=Kitasatospora sp. GAS1066B TaxID=3156271 RepID=UPI003517A357